MRLPSLRKINQQSSHHEREEKKRHVTFFDTIPEITYTYEYNDDLNAEERKVELWVPVDLMNATSRKDISETIEKMLSVNEEGSIVCAADDSEYTLRGIEQYYIENDDGHSSPAEIVESILEFQKNLKQKDKNKGSSSSNSSSSVDCLWDELRKHALTCTKHDIERAKDLAVQDAKDACVIHEENKNAITTIATEYYKHKVIDAEKRISSLKKNNEILKNKIKSQKEQLQREADQRTKALKEKNRKLKAQVNSQKKEILRLKEAHNKELRARIELQKKEILLLKKGNLRLQHSTRTLLDISKKNLNDYYQCRQ